MHLLIDISDFVEGLDSSETQSIRSYSCPRQLIFRHVNCPKKGIPMANVLSRRRALGATLATGMVGAGLVLGERPAFASAQAAPAVGGATTTATEYVLDSFAGATDDDKLVTAASFLGAQTHQQPLVLSGRDFTFKRPFKYTSGFKLVGSGCGWQNPEISSGRLTSQRVLVDVGVDAGAWLVGSGQVFDVHIANLSFLSSNGNSQFLHHPLPGTMYCCSFDNLALVNFKHGFGSTANKCAVTACGFGGRWSIINCLDTQFNLGGSDTDMWIGGQCNFGPADKGQFGNGQYMMKIDSLGKTNIGPMYFTADTGFRALEITGSTKYTDVVLSGARFEGRNAGDPSSGALVTIRGGNVRINDSWVAYGMSNPAAYAGTPDKALIQVLGGDVIIDGMRYDRATGVGQDVPLIYAGPGAVVELSKVRRATKGGAWTALPVVNVDPAATMHADASVRLT